MTQDLVFQSEKRVLNKIALLFTVPCAILPVMMATAGVISVPFAPMFFQYDFLLFGSIYAIYTYGLYLSWQKHRKFLPFLLFVIHLLSRFRVWQTAGMVGLLVSHQYNGNINQ